MSLVYVLISVIIVGASILIAKLLPPREADDER